MPWVPLPADAQLDNGAQPSPDATTAPTEAVQVSGGQTSSQSAPAPSPGFAPLPAGAQLDSQDVSSAIQGDQTAKPGDVVSIEAPPEVAKGLLAIWNDPHGTADQYSSFAAQHGFAVDPAVAEDAFAHRNGERLGQHVSASAVVQNPPPQPKAPDESISPLRQKVSDAIFDAIDGVLPGAGSVLRNHADSGRAYIENTADAVGGDFGPEIGGVMRTVAAPSEWGNFRQNLENNTNTERAIFEHDSEGHPIADVAGQLTGAGLAAPIGGEALDTAGVLKGGETALNAGRAVLQDGGTMEEARAAAAGAAKANLFARTTRVAASGAVYGAGSAGPGNRVEGAAIGAPLAVVTDAVLPALKAVIPGAKSVAKAPNYRELAQQLGIKRTPATASKTGVATVVQSGLGAFPGGGPIAQGAQREVADLGNAARGVAEGVGPVTSRQGAGEAVAQGAQAYKASSGAEGKTLYQQRDAAMGGSDAPVSLDNTKKQVADFAQQFQNSPALQQLREHPVIRKITDALGQASDDGQVTLGQATEALSHVRGVLRNLKATNGASPVVTSRVASMEQALEDDVMNGARAADQAMGREPGAPGSAVKAQQDADAFWADRSAALNGSLKKAIQSAGDDTKVSGEQVYNQVSGDMDAQSGNLARLRDTWFRLPEEAKSTFAATKIDDLGRATPGQQNATGDAWSFHTFLTNLNKLSPQARNIVFGSNADSQIQKIASYADRLKQLDRMRNFSNTAQKYFAGAFMATVGGAVMHGDIGTAAEAAMALPATWGGAKLLMSTPAMRDWTARALKVIPTGNEGAMRGLTQKLGAIAKSNTAIAPQVLGLQKSILSAVNDNALRGVAASPNPNAPQQDQRSQPPTP